MPIPIDGLWKQKSEFGSNIAGQFLNMMGDPLLIFLDVFGNVMVNVLLT